jgi:hypothetical protein
VAVYAIERAEEGVERAEGTVSDAEPFLQGPGAEPVSEQVDRVRRSLKTAAGHLDEALAAAESGDFAAAQEPIDLAGDEAREAADAGNTAVEAALDGLDADEEPLQSLLSAADDVRDQALEAELDVTAAADEVGREVD